MSKIIAGNFKMNKTLAECKDYVDAIKNVMIPEDREVVLFPPIFAVDLFSSCVNISRIKIGVQNCSNEEQGAFTGEVAASQIKALGADYVLLGHSERRNKLCETNAVINEKIVKAEENGLSVVLCVGEKLEEIKNRKEVLFAQIKECLLHANTDNIVIAYEPIWAIGTGKTCDTKTISEVHKYIKEVVKETTGKAVKVLYGGSVKASNAAEILLASDVDGVLVGGACLDAVTFAEIIRAGA